MAYGRRWVDTKSGGHGKSEPDVTGRPKKE
jgi:hypothetical protein